MAFSIKMVASELLMCGLKNLPFVGTAVEVVEGVRSRHEVLAHADRLAAAEQKLTRIEKGFRDLVATEIRTALENLSRPNLNGPALTKEIRNLQEIREQGWEPALFEGLLANSSHWEELRLNPQNYGRVLSDHDGVSRDNIPVLIETDSTRVLELTPFAFSQLLAGQAVGTPQPKIVSAQDVWAVPGMVSTPRSRPVGERMPKRWCVNFDVKPVLLHGFEEAAWLMQYQYSHGGYDFQGHPKQKAATSANWNILKGLQRGDWVVAYLPRSTFYAIGEVIEPRSRPRHHAAVQHTDTVKRTVDERRHHYLNGVVRYSDTAVLYEDFTDPWRCPAADTTANQPSAWEYSQRIDVRAWEHVVRNGVQVDGLAHEVPVWKIRRAAFDIPEKFFEAVATELRRANVTAAR